MEQDKKTFQMKPYHSVILFAVVMASMVAAFIMQVELGMWGLALTELMLLGLALLGMVIFKQKPKDVFPIKKPKARHLFGTLILWVGSYMMVILSTLVIGLFFPDELTDVSLGMADFFTSVPALVLFFIVAVMPAICEEALHRGILLKGFETVKRKWVVVFVMGLIFGLFHLDPIRFLGTALLGMALTYIMIETKNILLPILFHFINNALAVLILISSDGLDVDATVTQQALASGETVAALLILASGAPLLILWGGYLLASRKVNDEGKIEKIKPVKVVVTVLATAFLGLVMVVAGVAMLISSGLFEHSILNSNFTAQVDASMPPFVLDFEIEEEGVYLLSTSTALSDGHIEIEIIDTQKDELIYAIEGKFINVAELTLAPGEYQIIFTCVLDDDAQSSFGNVAISASVQQVAAAVLTQLPVVA